MLTWYLHCALVCFLLSIVRYNRNIVNGSQLWKMSQSAYSDSLLLYCRPRPTIYIWLIRKNTLTIAHNCCEVETLTWFWGKFSQEIITKFYQNQTYFIEDITKENINLFVFRTQCTVRFCKITLWWKNVCSELLPVD